MAKQITTEEELNAQIAAIEEMKAAAIEQFKTVKTAAIDAAVKKAGVGIQKDFKEYKSDKESVEELKKTLNEKLESMSSKYKAIKDALMQTGVKESYIDEFMGVAPKAKAVKAAGTGTGTDRAKRTAVVYPDGSKHTWTELALSQGMTEAELTGTSAHREFMAKFKKLPAGYKEE